MNIKVGVDDEVFQFWLKEVKNQFRLMTETMAKVVEEVRKETVEITPIKSGKLSRSFKDTYITRNSQMIVVQVRMSALNPRTGYDYAMIQHENPVYKHHPKDIGFFTYRKSSDGEYYHSMDNVWNIHQGEYKYLYKGIIYAEDTAMEIIEKDYLSMFNGGFIV